MKLVLAILVIAGLVFGAITVASQAITSNATDRVDGMMQSWLKGGVGGGVDIQTAVSLWSDGVQFIADADKLAGASDDFDRWRREQGLYRPIREFSITRVVPNKKYFPDEFIVHVAIDGRPYTMRVRSRAAIAWTDEQDFG